MKKQVLLATGIGLLIVAAGLTYFRYATKQNSPPAVAGYHQNNTDITVTYSRPYKKGRLIFGEETSAALQPYGKYWRVGANEATLFATNKDLIIDGKLLKPGKYSLYAYPGKESWQIVFNSDFERWGMPEPDREKDILNATVPSDNNQPVEEQFTITFTEADSGIVNMNLKWDQTHVIVPMKL